MIKTFNAVTFNEKGYVFTPTEHTRVSFSIGNARIEIAVNANGDGIEVRSVDTLLQIKPESANSVHIVTTANEDERAWRVGKSMHEAWKANETTGPYANRRKGDSR